MKIKLIYGLFGCSNDGVLYMPNGKRIIKLPKKLVFKIHTFLNHNFAYAGLKGTRLLRGD